MSNSKTAKEKNPQLEERNEKKGWFFYIHRFNDNLAQIVSFNTKLLLFILLVFLVYLVLASILQGETFSVNKLSVHPSIEKKGYNSNFIAKKISYDITKIVDSVPLKLVALFSGGGSIEKNQVLFKRIMDKYTKKEIKIDMEVNVGGFSVPLHQLTKTARSVFKVETKSLDGDLTVEDDLLIMTLGLNANGINKDYQSLKYSYQPADTVHMFDIIESITKDAAKFVLKKYDPLVAMLIDYNHKSTAYSSNDTVWREGVYKEAKRFQILKDLYLNEEQDFELAIWSHAITGAIYFQKFKDKKNPVYMNHSVQHFQIAIEMDPSFVDIVGSDLAKLYYKLKDTVNAIGLYENMIKSSPTNLDIHKKLLKYYFKQKDTLSYYRVLNSAYRNGFYIYERELKRPLFKTFIDEDEFNSLYNRYNDKNKRRFD